MWLPGPIGPVLTSGRQCSCQNDAILRLDHPPVIQTGVLGVSPIMHSVAQLPTQTGAPMRAAVIWQLGQHGLGTGRRSFAMRAESQGALESTNWAELIEAVAKTQDRAAF